MNEPDNDEIIRRLSAIYRIDFQRFAADCLRIRPKTGGIIPFHLNSVQLDLLERIYQELQVKGRIRFIILKARQMGVSTFIEAVIYWWTVHHTGTKSLVLTHLDDATKELFEMTRRYHEYTPKEFKVSAKRDSTNELVFGGIDCAIRTATAGSKNVGHGSTIQCLHWSEVSRSSNQEEMTTGVMQTVPSGDNSMIFLESTANGTTEYFHETWQAAKRNCAHRKTDTRNYSKVAGTDNQFTVKPPISPNETVYARMTCAVKPNPIKVGDELDEMVTENYANLVDYVLYRLFGAETESLSSQQKSALHYKQFVNGVMMAEKMKQHFKQGSQGNLGSKRQ